MTDEKLKTANSLRNAIRIIGEYNDALKEVLENSSVSLDTITFESNQGRINGIKVNNIPGLSESNKTVSKICKPIENACDEALLNVSNAFNKALHELEIKFTNL